MVVGQEKIARIRKWPRSQGGGVKLIYPGTFTGKRQIGPPEAVPVFYEQWAIIEVVQKKNTPKRSVPSTRIRQGFTVELTLNGRSASKPSD